jgi:hypothetical protein
MDVEHIVQDACSDDGTQEWLAKDSRVQAFIEKDAGMYDAVNRGFGRAAVVSHVGGHEPEFPDGGAFPPTPGRHRPRAEV